jgi:cytochrome P450
LIQEYVSLLISNMREDAKEGREVDMVQNFNLVAFDIISDLSFGESFGGLRIRTAHPWIKAFFDIAIIGTVMTQLVLLKIPIISILAGVLVLPMLRKRLGVMSYTKDKIEKRIDQGTDRPDFMSCVLRHNDEKGMSREEIQATFNVLMIAGSETTATLLAGCTYLLQKHPRVRQKLHAEIRDTFLDDKEITMLSVSHLTYLDAVIGESLRLYPPIPITLSRMTPPEGAAICGHWVPGNVCLLQMPLSYLLTVIQVSVGIPQFAAYTSPLNFVEPDSFAPERMLPEHDAKFDKDRKAVLQPFSAGPRNCIGKK